MYAPIPRFTVTHLTSQRFSRIRAFIFSNIFRWKNHIPTSVHCDTTPKGTRGRTGADADESVDEKAYVSLCLRIYELLYTLHRGKLRLWSSIEGSADDSRNDSTEHEPPQPETSDRRREKEIGAKVSPTKTRSLNTHPEPSAHLCPRLPPFSR